MKLQPVALLLFSLCLATILPQSAASISYRELQKASIRGRVVRVGTGEAIPAARVTITAESDKDRTSSTNQSGEFVFTGLDGGTYRLSATATGYSRGQYGERLASGSGRWEQP
jgi:hypothetical protein